MMTITIHKCRVVVKAGQLKLNWGDSVDLIATEDATLAGCNQNNWYTHQCRCHYGKRSHCGTKVSRKSGLIPTMINPIMR